MKKRRSERVGGNGVRCRPAGLPSPGARIGLFAVSTLAAVGALALLGGGAGVFVGLCALGACALVPPERAAGLAAIARGRRRVGPASGMVVIARRLETLAGRLGRRSPRPVLVTGDDAGAFALSTARGDVVLVTEGLLVRPVAERDAVLAHELAHLDRRDPLLVASLLAGPAALVTVVVAAVVGDAALGERLERLGDLAPVVPPIALVLGTALVAIGLGLGARLERSADTVAVALLGDAAPVIDALRFRRAEVGGTGAARALDVRLAHLGAPPFTGEVHCPASGASRESPSVRDRPESPRR